MREQNDKEKNMEEFINDYGMWLAKSGFFDLDTIHNFYDMYISSVARLDDNEYTVLTVIPRDNMELYASFDFEQSLFEEFVSQIPSEKREIVIKHLQTPPFCYEPSCEAESFGITFSAFLGTKVLTNPITKEQYIPLKIKSFQ
jgi:hypothetical protein